MGCARDAGGEVRNHGMIWELLSKVIPKVFEYNFAFQGYQCTGSLRVLIYGTLAAYIIKGPSGYIISKGPSGYIISKGPSGYIISKGPSGVYHIKGTFRVYHIKGTFRVYHIKGTFRVYHIKGTFRRISYQRDLQGISYQRDLQAYHTEPYIYHNMRLIVWDLENTYIGKTHKEKSKNLNTND